jgi:hypothetical protein
MYLLQQVPAELSIFRILIINLHEQKKSLPIHIIIIIIIIIRTAVYPYVSIPMMSSIVKARDSLCM